MTCAKRVVRCTIVTRDGRSVTGENYCRDPQMVCPRQAGEGYAKCGEICRQAGHAETVALEMAGYLELDLRGGTAIVSGHYHVCQACAKELRDAGVANIVIQVTP